MVAEGRSQRGWNFDLPDGERLPNAKYRVWGVSGPSIRLHDCLADGVRSLCGPGPSGAVRVPESLRRGWLCGAGSPSQLPAASSPQFLFMG